MTMKRGDPRQLFGFFVRDGGAGGDGAEDGAAGASDAKKKKETATRRPKVHELDGRTWTMEENTVRCCCALICRAMRCTATLCCSVTGSAGISLKERTCQPYACSDAL
jgi:hypothetical protein